MSQTLASPLTDRLAARMGGMDTSAVRDLLRVTAEPEIISLAGGFPAPELFPVVELAEAFASVFATDAQRALQYGTSEGHGPLRELLAARSAERGVACSVEQVMLTSGSQQALDLIGRMLLNPGDAVAVECPTYLGALQAFNQYQPRFVAVPTDDHGLDVEALANLLDDPPHPIKLLYVIPNFQNPSGRTMSLERRQQLARLSNERSLLIVEDDPYGELRYEGDRLPSIQAFDERGTVMYLSTFSKVLAPGLRLGWIVAAPEAVRSLLRAKQPADLCTSELTQMAVYVALGSGLVERQIPRLIEAYRPRRDALVAAVRAHFPADTRLVRPAGGMFAWAELPSHIDTTARLPEAVRAKVAYVPGRAFHVDGAGNSAMRLNFTNVTERRLQEGIERLATVLA